MSLGSSARRNGLWLLDRLRGGRVRRHYEDVKATMAGQPPTDQALSDLLVHASRTTSFYAPYQGRDLEAFPVIDKATVKGDRAGFESDAFAGAQLHRRKTSGSTGEPFVVMQDQGKRERSIADTIVFNEMAGQRLGDRLMWLFATQVLPMPKRRQIIYNTIPVDHLGLDVAASERAVGILHREGVNGILGPSSTLLVLAQYIEANDVTSDELGVKVVIANGENLVPPVRERIAAAFGCPVVNRYSSEDLGMLAIARPGNDRLYLNRASYHFEFLKLDADEPQLPDELARVVITDLYNRATPLIRFDTGDLAIVGQTDDRGEAIALQSLEGRRADVIFDTSGDLVPSQSASAIMSKSFPAMLQYQLVQGGAATYRLKVVQGDVSYAEAEIVAELRKWLGADARVAVEFVPSIPRLASGKYRSVICEYKPESATTSNGS